MIGELRRAIVEVAQRVRQLRSRVDVMVARAIITRVNDALKTQRLQMTILHDEVADKVEHLQPYGLSFTPPERAECIALAIGGARSHTVAICASHPGHRPTGNADQGTGGLYTQGEWRVFIDDEGVVHLGSNNPLLESPVALSSKVDIELMKIATAISSLGGSYSPGGAPPVGTPVAATGASKVKAT